MPYRVHVQRSPIKAYSKDLPSSDCLYINQRISQGITKTHEASELLRGVAIIVYLKRDL
jgi:hypothetical protein